MGAGRGFRMVLDAEDGMTTMPHPFQRPIVEIDMSDFNFRWQTFGANCKTMVVRRNFDTSSRDFLYGLIAPTMAKHQLERLATEGAAQ